MTPDAASTIQAGASNPAVNAWVSASAGSGKTKVLVDRVLRLLLSGTEAHRILCITFTKAAAANMAERINAELSGWVATPEPELEARIAALIEETPDAEMLARARRLFARVLDAPGGLQIQTIHSFCQSLLGRFPIEARVPPHFTVVEERNAGELLAEARRFVLSDGEEKDALDVAVRYSSEQDLEELIADLTTKDRARFEEILAEHGGVDGAIANVHATLDVPPEETEESVLAEGCREDTFDRIGLSLIARTLIDSDGKNERNHAAKIDAWLTGNEKDRIDSFQVYSTVFRNQDGTWRQAVLRKPTIAEHPAFADILKVEQARIMALCDRLARQVTANATAALLQIAHAVLRRYEREKAVRVVLDYPDLILRTRDLLEAPGIAAWVLFKLDGGLDHILVDEAQDTSPEQWQVIAALAEEFFAGEGARDQARTVFAVGDRKQSIFSFQGADPAGFASMQDHFRRRTQDAHLRWKDVPLEFSFRSTDAILQAVDAVYADDPARQGVVDGDHALHHLPIREGQSGLVEVWPPIGPDADGDVDVWAPPPDQQTAPEPYVKLAAAIADNIKAWIANERLPSRNRPIRAGDIMVLVRRRNALVDAMVRALKQRGVPVAGVDRMVLSEQIAVMDLLALARFLLLPEDDLNLACLLKSPLIGFDDDDLFDLAYGREGLPLWRRLDRESGEGRIAAARDWLRDLLNKTDFIRPYDLFADSLSGPCPAGPSGRHAMLSRLGPEAEDPIEEFLGMALAFERLNPPSLQGFLHWFDAGRAEIKRDLEQAERDEVRIMTVHAAKGLQAPVVILPDTLGKPQQTQRLLWEGASVLWLPRTEYRGAVAEHRETNHKAREMEEYRRLLYVAMTRAEDRLYVCGWHGAKSPPQDTWYSLIEDAVGKLPDVRCISPDKWDGPAELVPGDVRRFQTAQTGMPEPDDTTAPEDAPSVPLGSWAFEPPDQEPVAGAPLSPSRPGVDDPPPRSPKGGDGIALFRRGNLIHRLLQHLPDLPVDDRKVLARRWLDQDGRDLSPEEREDIVAEVLAVIEDPALAALFGPGSRPEVPIVGRVVDSAGQSRVISGQVDRLCVTSDAVLVADYKTMRPAPRTVAETPAAYLAQLAAYRAVLAEIWPDRPVRAALVWTEEPRLMEVPGALLDPILPGS